MIDTVFASAGREAGLEKKFSDVPYWPLARVSLAALVDLGMSDRMIAEYFARDAADVAKLKRDYSL